MIATAMMPRYPIPTSGSGPRVPGRSTTWITASAASAGTAVARMIMSVSGAGCDRPRRSSISVLHLLDRARRRSAGPVQWHRRPAASGSQDTHRHQHSKDGGGPVGDRVGNAETGCGGLRPRRRTDEKGGPAGPARATMAAACGPDADRGGGKASRHRHGGFPHLPDGRRDKAAPGQVQGSRGEQQHSGHAPAGQPARDRCRRTVSGSHGCFLWRAAVLSSRPLHERLAGRGAPATHSAAVIWPCHAVSRADGRPSRRCLPRRRLPPARHGARAIAA